MLQAFHKAKAFKDSPTKAHYLHAISGKKSNLVFDPRTEHLRNKVETVANFRNSFLNFAHIVSSFLNLSDKTEHL